MTMENEMLTINGDVSTMFSVYDEKDGLLMRAPMATIAYVWCLHDSAAIRINHETKEPGGLCKLHANGRECLGGEFITIQRGG
jgi:hypothetical protein